MATSGTTAFTLDLGDIMEEAYDLCGSELRSGYDYRGAKRALNLIFLEWQNKGLNLWKIEQATQTLTAGTNTYTLESSALNRISRTEYNHQASKLLQSKPTQFFIDKGTSSNSIVLWATPDSAETYTLVYDYIKRIEDAGNVASNNADVPSRYLPCLTYALAYNLACKIPEAQNRVAMIKQRYDELWNDVSDADRERAPVKFVPDINLYR